MILENLVHHYYTDVHRISDALGFFSDVNHLKCLIALLRSVLLIVRSV